jgi:putative ABC transport system ATP-binding protein
MTAEPAIIELQALRYAIGARTILDLAAWRLAQGRHCLILGPSGSGKTTLLHLLAGIARPAGGQILIDGQRLDALGRSKLDIFRGRRIGIVFQALHLLPALSVRDNLRLAQYLAGLPQNDAALHETLAALGIADKAQRRPAALSRGEAQRVAIARAVINHPDLILADEPTASLDDANAEQVVDLLLDQAGRHAATLVVATHDSRIKPYFPERLELHTQAAQVRSGQDNFKP